MVEGLDGANVVTDLPRVTIASYFREGASDNTKVVVVVVVVRGAVLAVV